MGTSVSSQSVSSQSVSSGSGNVVPQRSLAEIESQVKEATDDIKEIQIQQMYFAKCPIRGWFVNHWALIMEQEDGCFLSVQFVKSGLEVDRAFNLLSAKDCVSRCSLSQVEFVTARKIGKTEMTVGQIVDAALTLSREYNFVTYNCRHFVFDLLKIIKATSFQENSDEEVEELQPEKFKSIAKK